MRPQKEQCLLSNPKGMPEGIDKKRGGTFESAASLVIQILKITE